MVARPAPICWCEKLLSLSPTPAKGPTLSFTDDGSHLRGARLTGDYKDQKNHAQGDAHCGRKNLSLAQPATAQLSVDHNREVGQRRAGRDRATVKTCNPAGRDEA